MEIAHRRITMITMGCRQVNIEYHVRPVELRIKKFGIIITM
jgi:hypothetical protein